MSHLTSPHRQHHSTFLILAMLTLAGFGWYGFAGSERPEAVPHDEAASDRLAVVWTSADPDVAHRMTLMYTHGAQRGGWFDEVRLIIWGPSQRLVIGDKDIRAKIAALKSDGVHVQACLACADSYGIADDLRELDIEVKYMGTPLSDHIKDDGWHVLTF